MDYRILKFPYSQVMREWAMADNQSKNLPKADRQALNEVRQLPVGHIQSQPGLGLVPPASSSSTPSYLYQPVFAPPLYLVLPLLAYVGPDIVLL